MLLNKALLGKLPLSAQREAVQEVITAKQEGREYTLFGKRLGVVISTYDTIQEARRDIRNYSVFPRTTTESIKLGKIMRTLGIR